MVMRIREPKATALIFSSGKWEYLEVKIKAILDWQKNIKESAKNWDIKLNLKYSINLQTKWIHMEYVFQSDKQEFRRSI